MGKLFRKINKRFLQDIKLVLWVIMLLGKSLTMDELDNFILNDMSIMDITKYEAIINYLKESNALLYDNTIKDFKLVRDYAEEYDECVEIFLTSRHVNSGTINRIFEEKKKW